MKSRLQNAVDAQPMNHQQKIQANDREFILGVTATLMRQNGFEGTTLRQIAEACDMLPGSLHYRYRTKEAILIDLMRLSLERATQSIVEACQGIDDPLEQVRASLRAHLRVLVNDSDMVFVLLFEWRALKGAAREEMIGLRDSYEKYWMLMIDRIAALGLLRQDADPVLLRLIGFGAINWVATWYDKKGPHTLNQIADAIWSMINQGILDQSALHAHRLNNSTGSASQGS